MKKGRSFIHTCSSCGETVKLWNLSWIRHQLYIRKHFLVRVDRVHRSRKRHLSIILHGIEEPA